MQEIRKPGDGRAGEGLREQKVREKANRVVSSLIISMRLDQVPMALCVVTQRASTGTPPTGVAAARVG